MTPYCLCRHCARGADDTTEDAPADTAEPTFAPADGSFACSWAFHGGAWDGATCDRATQYCFLQGGIGYSPDGCRSFACGPNSPSDAGCGPIEWDAATCAGGVRRYSCLSTYAVLCADLLRRRGRRRRAELRAVLRRAARASAGATLADREGRVNSIRDDRGRMNHHVGATWTRASEAQNRSPHAAERSPAHAMCMAKVH
jgi:hypothetical protein